MVHFVIALECVGIGLTVAALLLLNGDGAKGFVDKPFHREQLLKVFGEALC